MKLISKTFSKSLFYTTLGKEQWSAPFVEHHVKCLLAAQSGRKWNF